MFSCKLSAIFLNDFLSILLFYFIFFFFENIKKKKIFIQRMLFISLIKIYATSEKMPLHTHSHKRKKKVVLAGYLKVPDLFAITGNFARLQMFSTILYYEKLKYEELDYVVCKKIENT